LMCGRYSRNSVLSQSICPVPEYFFKIDLTGYLKDCIINKQLFILEMSVMRRAHYG
jgi:hypothetical protein